MNKELIKRELWHRDFIHKFQINIVEQAAEDIGLVSEDIRPTDNIYRTIVAILTSYIINYLFDKAIDEILNIINKEEGKNERSGNR